MPSRLRLELAGRMTTRLLWLLALAAATSACLGVRGPPRFGSLRIANHPFEFRHGIRVYTVKNGMTLALLPDRRTNLVTVDARYLPPAARPDRAGGAAPRDHLRADRRRDLQPRA